MHRVHTGCIDSIECAGYTECIECIACIDFMECIGYIECRVHRVYIHRLQGVARVAQLQFDQCVAMEDVGVALIFSTPHERRHRLEVLSSTIGLLVTLARSTTNPALHLQLQVLMHELIELAMVLGRGPDLESDHDDDEDDSDTSSSIPVDPPNARDSSLC